MKKIILVLLFISMLTVGQSQIEVHFDGSPYVYGDKDEFTNEITAYSEIYTLFEKLPDYNLGCLVEYKGSKYFMEVEIWNELGFDYTFSRNSKMYLKLEDGIIINLSIVSYNSYFSSFLLSEDDMNKLQKSKVLKIRLETDQGNIDLNIPDNAKNFRNVGIGQGGGRGNPQMYFQQAIDPLRQEVIRLKKTQ